MFGSLPGNSTSSIRLSTSFGIGSVLTEFYPVMPTSINELIEVAPIGTEVRKDQDATTVTANFLWQRWKDGNKVVCSKENPILIQTVNRALDEW
ncbi:hypothetical protein ACH5RR_032917 [Cinchona calisaya]|uniref:Uncharacterized protein n=1 Tax=Cinchona calisaya TaxID=153742 RepID=A0ABD2YNM6_9GENT